MSERYSTPVLENNPLGSFETTSRVIEHGQSPDTLNEGLELLEGDSPELSIGSRIEQATQLGIAFPRAGKRIVSSFETGHRGRYNRIAGRDVGTRADKQVDLHLQDIIIGVFAYCIELRALGNVVRDISNGIPLLDDVPGSHPADAYASPAVDSALAPPEFMPIRTLLLRRLFDARDELFGMGGQGSVPITDPGHEFSYLYSKWEEIQSKRAPVVERERSNGSQRPAASPTAYDSSSSMLAQQIQLAIASVHRFPDGYRQALAASEQADIAITVDSLVLTALANARMARSFAKSPHTEVNRVYGRPLGPAMLADPVVGTLDPEGAVRVEIVGTTPKKDTPCSGHGEYEPGHFNRFDLATYRDFQSHIGVRTHEEGGENRVSPIEIVTALSAIYAPSTLWAHYARELADSPTV